MNLVVPKVAVITRTKDRLLLLRRCLESVLAQQFTGWTHVIVNDGGDATALDLLLQEYAVDYQGRLQVFHNPQSLGMQNASNVGIEGSQSEFLAIHDDDDSWHPLFLEVCVEELAEKGAESPVQGVITQTIRVFEEINSGGRVSEVRREPYKSPEHLSLFHLASDNQFAPIAFVYRRAVHEKIGLFDERFSVLGDWDFNLRFMREFDIAVIPQNLAFYHWRSTTIDSVYANTVTNGAVEHQEKASFLRNHYLRQDLREGRIGFGYLVNVAKAHTSQSHAIHEVWGKSNLFKTQQDRFSARLQRLEWFLTQDKSARPARKAKLIADVLPVAQFNLKKRDLRAAAALSLDVFDTALLRLVAKPIDLFLFMQDEVRALLKSPDLPFVQARILAEKNARTVSADAGGSAEILLADIYWAFCELARVDASLQEPLMALELATEARLCYASPRILSLSRDARALGRPVVFVSDMYLPAKAIRELLQKNGYEVETLLVSAVEKVSKHDGAMFPLLVKKMGVSETSEILHIGDNARSDFGQARLHGLTAHLYQSPLNERPYAEQTGSGRLFSAENLLESLTIGLARRKRSTYGRIKPRSAQPEYWTLLGYELAGPLYLGYAQWLIQQASLDGIEHLFLLARDGYNLQQVFERMIARWKLPLKTTYLFASRRLLNISGIVQLDRTALDFLLTANPGLRLRDFFERAGLVAENYWSELRPLGFKSLNEVLTKAGGVFISNNLYFLLRDFFRTIELDILRIAAAERAQLFTYFDQVGFAGPGIAVVDVGWQASLLHSLQKLLSLREGPQRLRGYYFGTWHHAQKAVDDGCLLESMFCHLDKPEGRGALLGECVELVEFLFGAPHPTITGLRPGEGGKMEAVYGQSELMPHQVQWSEWMRAGALAYVDDLLDLMPNPRPDDSLLGYIEPALRRFLVHPLRDEARLLGTLLHRDGFGDTSPLRPLAHPPGFLQRIFQPRSIKTAQQNSYWKKGYQAQLSARELNRL